jgi:hypothetical protein
MKDNPIEPGDHNRSRKEQRYTADTAVKSRLLKNVLRPMALLTFGTLGWIEKILWPWVELHYSPVFIVAPPRSGTTLLYQLMTGYMSVCYFTNLAQRLRVQGSEILPALSARLVKLLGLGQRQDGSLESYYGATAGWGGPNEANGIWERWFPEREHAVPPGHLSANDQKGVYRAVAVTERVFDRPFVNKCIRNSVRVQALAEIFPTALFIECTRDRLDMAQSIFVARTRALPFKPEGVEDPSQWWWSVKPKEYESIRHKGITEQICEQVFFVEQSIDAARHALGGDRFLSVDYRDLCHTPQRELRRVVEFMNDHNAPTEIICPIPDSFPYSRGRKIDQADYVALAGYLSQLYGQSIPVMQGVTQ